MGLLSDYSNQMLREQLASDNLPSLQQQMDGLQARDMSPGRKARLMGQTQQEMGQFGGGVDALKYSGLDPSSLSPGRAAALDMSLGAAGRSKLNYGAMGDSLMRNAMIDSTLGNFARGGVLPKPKRLSLREGVAANFERWRQLQEARKGAPPTRQPGMKLADGAVALLNSPDWQPPPERGLRGGIVRGPGGPTDDAVPMTLSGVPVNLSNQEAVLPAKTVNALGGPQRVEQLIEQTNGRPPVKKGLRSGGAYQDGLVGARPGPVPYDQEGRNLIAAGTAALAQHNAAPPQATPNGIKGAMPYDQEGARMIQAGEAARVQREASEAANKQWMAAQPPRAREKPTPIEAPPPPVQAPEPLDPQQAARDEVDTRFKAAGKLNRQAYDLAPSRTDPYENARHFTATATPAAPQERSAPLRGPSLMGEATAQATTGFGQGPGPRRLEQSFAERAMNPPGLGNMTGPLYGRPTSLAEQARGLPAQPPVPLPEKPTRMGLFNQAHALAGDGISAELITGKDGKPQASFSGSEPTQNLYVGRDGVPTNRWEDTASYNDQIKRNATLRTLADDRGRARKRSDMTAGMGQFGQLIDQVVDQKDRAQQAEAARHGAELTARMGIAGMDFRGKMLTQVREQAARQLADEQRRADELPGALAGIESDDPVVRDKARRAAFNKGFKGGVNPATGGRYSPKEEAAMQAIAYSTLKKLDQNGDWDGAPSTFTRAPSLFGENYRNSSTGREVDESALKKLSPAERNYFSTNLVRTVGSPV